MPSFMFHIRKYLQQQKLTSLFVSSKSSCDIALQQRQTASKEASYIKSLSYWPIAKTKVFAKSDALVYLRINKDNRDRQFIKDPHLHGCIVSMFEFKLKKH